MIRLALAAGVLMAFVPAEPFTASGSNFTGSYESAMRQMDINARTRCGMENRESGYTASDVQCGTTTPTRAGGTPTTWCRATITCNNSPHRGPPPLPAEARPQ